MKIPRVIFKTRVGDHESLGGGCAIGGAWKNVSTDDLFKGKRVVVFSLPGAYTPTCSSQQVPGYEEKYEALKAQGIDEVYCVSVNDSFVMNAWFRSQNITKVKPIADGEGKLTAGMGMLVYKPGQGFGMRSWRYSAVVDNGEAIKMFIEAGRNDESNDNDPYIQSTPETMLEYLIKIGSLKKSQSRRSE
jgi:peroxiredoxin